MSVELLDAIHGVRHAASYVSDNVNDVADLLSEIGMEKLAKRLRYSVEGLPELAKRLSDAHSEKIYEDIAYSEKMTANMMILALKGISK